MPHDQRLIRTPGKIRWSIIPVQKPKFYLPPLGLAFVIRMEHFWTTGLIALVFSSLVSSEQKYIMETLDCSTCIWSWDTAAYVQVPGFATTVCFRDHLNGSTIT